MLAAQKEFTGATPHSEWLSSWIDWRKVRPDSWRIFWLKDVTEQAMPRSWLRFTMRLHQGTKKVTAGTPVDNQIAT
jgi:hypothetical protein